MKRKWWLLFAAAASALLLSLCFFGVRVRIAPRLILSRALGTATQKLVRRFDESPFHLIFAAIDPGGCQRAEVQLETRQELLGIVRYDLDLSAQLSPCRVYAEGTVVTGGKAMDLSVYMDGDFAAVSSESLAEGSRYGITYDTFPQDIRSRQLLAALIGEKKISAWEQSVSTMDQTLSGDWKPPAFRMEDIASVLYGVLTLKPEVSRVSTPAGVSQFGHAVTFQVDVQEIAQAAEDYRDDLPREIMTWLDGLKKDPNALILVEFLLHRENLVQIRVETKSGRECTCISVVLGDHPDTGELTVEITSRAGETDHRSWLGVETVSNEETYQEQLCFVQTRNGLRSELRLDYGFDPDTGELNLKILRDGEEAKVRINLSGEGETVTVRSGNLRPLLNILSDKHNESPVICTLTLSPGKAVDVPQYRNLDQWSMDDLYTLLSGLGGLLGLKMP